MTNKIICHDGCQSNKVVPGEETNIICSYVVDGSRNSIKVHSFASASLWDGYALRETDAYSGH